MGSLRRCGLLVIGGGLLEASGQVGLGSIWVVEMKWAVTVYATVMMRVCKWITKWVNQW